MQYTVNLNLKKPDLTDYVDIRILNENADALDTAIQNKVDKVAGKQLSTEDYSTAEKTKLANLPVTTYDRASAVLSGANVFSNIVITDGAVTSTATRALTKADIGLGSLLDYGIATQAEAEAGTSDVKYMTPLKVKQEITALSFAKSSIAPTAGTIFMEIGNHFMTSSTDNPTMVGMISSRIRYLGASGTARFKFSLRGANQGVTTAQIYKNGSPFGTLRTNNTTNDVWFEEDLQVNTGDMFMVYASNSKGLGSGYTANVGRLTLGFSTIHPINIVIGEY